MLSIPRRILKRIHPEGIPWPGSLFYNRVSRTGIFQKHYDRLAREIAEACPSGRVLDVGTGPAWLLRSICRVRPELALFGADISPAMVERARKNLAEDGLSEKIEVVTAGAGDLPFEDGFFDLVVSTGSVHHWKEPEAGLDEIHRVLAPGGRALICDIVSDTPREVMARAAREFGRLRMFLLWVHAFEEPFYTARDFKALAERTAFKNGSLRYVGVMACLDMVKA